MGAPGCGSGAPTRLGEQRLGSPAERTRARCGRSGDELLRDAVPDDREEADLLAGAADLVDDAPALARDVDDGNRHGASLG